MFLDGCYPQLLFSLSKLCSAVEVRTAVAVVAVVAGPVALQDFNVASCAKSWKLVLATHVDAVLVCEDFSGEKIFI